MALRIFVEVESAPGVVIGSGPITDITSLRVANRLNQAGSWEMTLPANVSNADLLTDQATVMAYVLINGVKTFLGGGAIDRKNLREDDSGKLTLRVGGVGLLGEWSREALESLVLDGSGTENIEEMLALKPAGWAVSLLDESADFTRVFVNESLFSAIVAVAKQMGHIFCLKTITDVPRTLFYRTDWATDIFGTTVALTCVMNLNALEAEDNDNLATIVNIEEARTSYDIANRVYVYGFGEGENQLTMAAATVWPDDSTALSSSYIAPSGDEYFYNAANNRITNADSYARLGDNLRSKRLDFPDIRMMENSDAGMEMAANMLVKAAVAHLERHRSAQVTYKFKLADLRTRLYPGDLIHIDARRWIDGVRVLDIDADVYVLGVTDVLDANGMWTADIEASNIPAWPEDTVTQIAQDTQIVKTQTAHVQLTGNIDTVTFRETLAGATPLNTIWVFLATEVALINDVRLRYYARPIELPLTESTAYTPTTSGASLTGSTGVPSTSSTAHVTLDAPDHVHGLSAHTHPANTIASHAHTLTYGYSSQNPSLTYGVADLEFNINGESSGGLVWRTGSLLVGAGVDSWYELDITAQVRNATTKRPESGGSPITNFYVDMWVPPADVVASHSCLVDIQVQVRTAIQQQATF